MSKLLIALALLAAMALFAPASLADGHEGPGAKGKSKAARMQDKSERKAGAAEEAREGAREGAGAAAEEAEERARERAGEAGGKAAEARERADTDRGEAMKARRDERKQVMDEAKSASEPGTPRKGKKPWWRFWEGDEE